MKKLLVIFLILLISNISSAQSGWGYVNYTSYKTHNGNGDQSQYNAFANTAADFDKMFNTANSNTTISHTGETAIANLYNGSSAVPRWNNDFFGYKFEFFFVPQQTGLYYFGINSDDASDLFVDGVSLVTYYGGHGASSWQVVGKNMVAGQRYKMVYRGQEYGGGEAFYFMWYRPVGGWGYWNNEVTNVGIVPTKQVKMNFDFGSTLDKTKFNVGSALSSTGWVDITNLLDSTKVNTGNKALTTGGQVEWCVIYDYDTYNNRYRIGIDSRQMSVTANTVNQLKLFDLWDGPVSFGSYDPNGWSEYFIYTNTPLNFSNSTYSSHIRVGNGYYALTADFSYTPTQSYKQQSVTITTTNTISTLYNSIVTVADVWLAFKEVANVGIFGNQIGNEFTYGIQYKNADVNDDGVFDESDAYALLQHLTGKKTLVDTFNLKKTLKLMTPTQYNTIGKSNWNTSPSYLTDIYNFDINTGKAVDTFNLVGTWKGDVNLSHSATPASNGITTMSTTIRTMSVSTDINLLYDTEMIGDSIVVSINVNPLQQQLAGIQFDLNFDKLINYSATNFSNQSNMNFARLGSGVVSIGSLNISGQPLGNTSYKISFKPTTKIDGILGLISISNYEAIDVNGKSLKVKVL